MKKIIKGPYKVLESKKIYQNQLLCLYEDNVNYKDGENAVFNVIKMKAGSSVLVLTTKNNIYLVKEYKYAIEHNSLEVVSGGLKAKESPLDAAKRELKEELGIEARKWINLGIIDPFTAAIRSPNFLFVAQGIKRRESSPDESEFIKAVKVSLAETVDMVLRGEITHSASCVLILKAAYLKEQRMIA